MLLQVHEIGEEDHLADDLGVHRPQIHRPDMTRVGVGNVENLDSFKCHYTLFFLEEALKVNVVLGVVLDP